MDAFKKESNIFKILSEAVSEGIIIVNTSHIIVETNDSANQIFGYEKEELVGQHLDILIPNQYRHGHNEHVSGFMEKGQKRQMGRGRDLHGRRKDGSEFPVEAGLNPFSVYENDYVMALVIDIS